MKKFINKLVDNIVDGTVGSIILIVLLIILIVGAIYAISWIITCGVVALICLCFGLEFKWLIATGIWLIILVLKSIFQVTVKKD